MYDKSTRRYFTLIFAIYLTALLGLSVVTATLENTKSVQVAAEPKGSSAPNHTTPPKRDAYTHEKATPPTIRDIAKTWFLKRSHLEEWVCIDKLIYRESRWTVNAQNPHSTAFGLGQVKGSRQYTYDKPMKQFKLAVRVAIHKHGTLCRALNHSIKHGWY